MYVLLQMRLHMVFARRDLECSVIKSGLLSLNEYTFYCLAESYTAIAMIAHPPIARIEVPALAPYPHIV